MTERKPIDWYKPLQIWNKTYGDLPIHVVGKNIAGRLVVQIKYPTAERIPEYHVPDVDGYMVEFDRVIENIPPKTIDLWICMYHSGHAEMLTREPTLREGRPLNPIAIRKITLTEGEFDLDGTGIVDK